MKCKAPIIGHSVLKNFILFDASRRFYGQLVNDNRLNFSEIYNSKNISLVAQ